MIVLIRLSGDRGTVWAALKRRNQSVRQVRCSDRLQLRSDSDFLNIVVQPAKVVAHSGKPHRMGELVSVVGKSPPEEFPKLASLVIKHPQPENYTAKRHDAAPKTVVVWFRWSSGYAPQCLQSALIVFAGTVDGS